MKCARTFPTGLIILPFLAPAGSSPQGRMKHGANCGWGSEYNRMYDPARLESASGEVVAVNKIIPMTGVSYGIHLALKTKTGTISVHLGPSWFVENQDTKIAVSEKIVVTGSGVSIQGSPVLIAAKVIKGDEVLSLRDSSGHPLWSGWRRR